MATYAKPSMFPPAAFPSMMSEPPGKRALLMLMMLLWMSMFETEKIAPCRPAGRPLRMIPFSAYFSSLIFLISKWQKPVSLCRIMARMTMETMLEMPVASETPSTDMPKPRTKSRFSPTFRMPVIVSTTSGVLVSPLALKIEMRKFVAAMKGTPRK